MLNWFKSKLNKQKDKPDEGITYSSGNVFLKIEGNEYRVKVDSISAYQKAIEMSTDITKIQANIADQNSMIKIISTVKNFIIMMLGQDAYVNIFDTDEKRDDYTWHLTVFEAIFEKVIEFKMMSYNKIVNSPMLDKIKELQELTGS